jgi:hypothetical protein
LGQVYLAAPQFYVDLSLSRRMRFWNFAVQLALEELQVITISVKIAVAV